jgi:hypothetical protein
MKPCLAILFALLLIAAAQSPAPAAFAVVWNANENDDTAGYLVYSGPASREYDQIVDVGLNTRADLWATGLVFVAVAAYDAEGQVTDYSAEVFFTPPAPKVFTDKPRRGNARHIRIGGGL